MNILYLRLVYFIDNDSYLQVFFNVHLTSLLKISIIASMIIFVHRQKRWQHKALRFVAALFARVCVFRKIYNYM